MTKNFALFCVCLVVLLSKADAQTLIPVPSKEEVEKYKVNATSKSFSVPRSGEVNMDADNFIAMVRAIRHGNPDDSMQHDTEMKIRHKLANQDVFGSDRRLLKSANNDSMRLGISYNANPFNGGTPMDNTIAVSNGGIVVSAVNSNISIYDSTGNLIRNNTFNASFFGDLSLTSIIYDPKVIYDSQEDRFIVVVLHGSSSSTSRLLVMFSKSGNPGSLVPSLGGWYFYQIKGDPFFDGSWFDYPNIAVTNDELIISGNLFDNTQPNSQFVQPVIFQVDKKAGYSNSSVLPVQSWGNIVDGRGVTPFTLVPAGFGHQGNYGPGVYMVSNASGGGDKIQFYHLTNIASAPDEQILKYSIDVPFYLAAVSAGQLGTGVRLDEGRNRIRNAFFLDGIIHFVFASSNPNFFGEINYNRLDVNSRVIVNKTFGLNGFDYAYPAVASFSKQANNRSVVIGFLASSNGIYPEIRAVACDHDMNFSNSILVKAGTSYVNLFNDPTRWGDYTGISRRHNSKHPEVWISGSYGVQVGAARRWANFNAQLITRDEPQPDIVKGEFNLFPNPAVEEFVNLDFNLPESGLLEISLVEMSGKTVKILFRDEVIRGVKQLSFSKSGIASGYHVVYVKLGEKVIKKEKLLILHRK